jgi:SET domain-containing protein
MRDERLRVRTSRPGLGRGLFTLTMREAGELIAEYTGNRIPTPYADTLKTRYLFALDENWALDGSSKSNIARYINHSCVPNCEAEIHDGRIFILATRGIAAGEELTIDYGGEYFDEFIRPVGCKCERCTLLAGSSAPVVH